MFIIVNLAKQLLLYSIFATSKMCCRCRHDLTRRIIRPGYKELFYYFCSNIDYPKVLYTFKQTLSFCLSVFDSPSVSPFVCLSVCAFVSMSCSCFFSPAYKSFLFCLYSNHCSTAPLLI